MKRAVQTTRRRGAQPGNQNAFKHGFYSRRFSSQDLNDLQENAGPGLDGEIAMLRVIMRRLFEVAQTEAADLDSWAESLRTLSLAASRLAGLLRTEKMLVGSADEVAAALSEAMAQVVKELEA